MKKILLFLALGGFLAGQMAHAPEAEAATTHSKTHKTKVHKAKSSKAKVSAKAKSKSKNKLKSKKHTKVVKHSPAHARVMKVAYDDVWQGGDLDLRSSAALVVDQQSGEALYAKNMDVATPIASITKLMTAMVTLDAGLPLDEEIVIGREDVDRLKGSSSRLALGTRLTREELLHMALIASENRAAAALSRVYPGGRPAFVAAMNRKAQAIGMKQAFFADGTGLNSENRASAADLVKMVDAAYHYPLIRQITSTGNYDIAVTGQKIVRIRENGKIHRVSREVQRHIAFNNTNSLTRNGDWDIGVSKTGYISEAGHCLVMQAKIAEQKVIIVLLDSWGKWSRIGDANRIKKWLERGNENHIASRLPRSSV